MRDYVILLILMLLMQKTLYLNLKALFSKNTITF